LICIKKLKLISIYNKDSVEGLLYGHMAFYSWLD